MRVLRRIGILGWTAALLPALLFAVPATSSAQDKLGVKVYGFGMADAIVDFDQNNPDWYDVLRPSKLPRFENEFGRDGHFYLSARQSRLGAMGTFPEENVKGQLEFDFFGVGRDAGLTTIRLRHAWGQWKQFGAGQTNSVFMDVDVFPNVLDYWGPNGMLFFRNVMFFWQPKDDEKARITIAIENPGGSGDAGVYADRVELEGVRARFPAPDLTAEYRHKASWGYVEGAGILRWFKVDDLQVDNVDLSDEALGWGLSLSSNLKYKTKDVFRLQFIYGEGIQNYFNDAPVDVAARRNTDSSVHPLDAAPLPIFGMSTYLDHNWSTKLSSSIGYSRVDIDNSNAQTADAFQSGQYASVNLLYMPIARALIGPELQWAHRDNNSDGFSVDQVRVQISAKFSFDAFIGG